MSDILEWENLDFPSRVALKSRSEKSFLNFTRIWFELLQSDRLLVNWHHKMMAAKLDDLVNNRLQPRNLIVNVPPGGTKTEFISVHLPAYINMLVQTGQLRRFRNLNVSFADTLVKRNSRRTRDIIASPEYQSLWPCRFGINQAEEWEIVNKLMQVALFTAANRNRSFVNVLTEQQEAPKSVNPDKKGTTQTSHNAPVVRITDLQKQKGDEVDMQIVHKLSKRPTMGDEKLAGRGENLAFADFSLKINQGRHLVDAGGKMSEQRFKHNLNKTARTLLGTYFNDVQDQSATFHLAGARGDYMADDTIVPLADHGEFGKIMINDVLPPTYDRHFYSGDATSMETLDAADLFTLATVDNIALFLDEMAHPLQPIRMSKDELANEDPYFVLYVTPRQWNDWYTSTSGKDWQAMMTRAVQRSKGFDHPLFKGECAMWRNVLVPRRNSGITGKYNPVTAR
ncbi:TPA: N4-gp56 family major capsid protein [Yersinia enterocolitica]|nr:phage protein [Yersinia enterocolitica]